MIRTQAIIDTVVFSGAPAKLHYLSKMFTNTGGTNALGAAISAGVCWMLMPAWLDVGLAYPVVAPAPIIASVTLSAWNR